MVIQGGLAATDQSDSFEAAGSVSGAITGDFAASDGTDSFSATGDGQYRAFSGAYNEEETTTAGDWAESLTTSGTYSQSKTATSGSQGQGLSVASGDWSEAA